VMKKHMETDARLKPQALPRGPKANVVLLFALTVQKLIPTEAAPEITIPSVAAMAKPIATNVPLKLPV